MGMPLTNLSTRNVQSRGAPCHAGGRRRRPCQDAPHGLPESGVAPSFRRHGTLFAPHLTSMNATMADRERQLLNQVTTLAQALHQERERLASRLAELELELSVLASKLDGPPAVCVLGASARRRG